MDRFKFNSLIGLSASVIFVTLLVSGCATDPTAPPPPPKGDEYDLNSPADPGSDLERTHRQWLEESEQNSRLNRHR